jgi:hypothetical protein
MCWRQSETECIGGNGLQMSSVPLVFEENMHL